MKAAVVVEPGVLMVKDVPEPKINNYQALVEVLACATCNATDNEIINGDFIVPMNYPGILGHESVGRVIEVGEKVKNYKAGDLVLKPLASYPGDKLGDYHCIFGGFTELGIVTDYKSEMEDKNKTESDFSYWYLTQQKIPSNFNPIDSTLIITFREVLAWLYRFGVNNKSRVVIIGSGQIGMSFIAYSKILGASQVIMIGRRDERLKISTDIGADFVINNIQECVKDKVLEYTEGSGATHIIIAVNNYDLINDAFSYLQRNGKIGIYGVANVPGFNLNWSKAPTTWSLTSMDYDERISHQQVIDSIKTNIVDPKKFYSHIVDLENINEGFKLLKEKKALKVIVKIK